MPELPEVEVVKRSLEREINNLTIKEVKIFDGNLRYKVKKQDINKVIGLRILKIKRRAKYLLFFFEKNFVLLIHLGMTGKFFIIKKNNAKQKTSFYYEIEKNDQIKHNRVIFIFKNDLKLIYHDVRKFGFIKFEFEQKITENKHLKFLGPEPLSTAFNLKYFKNYLVGKKKLIKDLLMDQKFVSGLGNIYVNEILYLSKVKPIRKINKLQDIEIKKIIKYMRKVLKKAIFYGGSSIKDFSHSTGNKGNFQQHFNVYGKKGHKCSNSDCNGLIKKIILSNRSSFFCSKCQK